MSAFKNFNNYFTAGKLFCKRACPEHSMNSRIKTGMRDKSKRDAAAEWGSTAPPNSLGTVSRHGRLSAGGGILGCEGGSCPLSLMGSSSAQLSLFDNFIINLFINSSTAVRKRKQGPILMPDFWKSHSTRHHTV